MTLAAGLVIAVATAEADMEAFDVIADTLTLVIEVFTVVVGMFMIVTEVLAGTSIGVETLDTVTFGRARGLRRSMTYCRCQNDLLYNGATCLTAGILP